MGQSWGCLKNPLYAGHVQCFFKYFEQYTCISLWASIGLQRTPSVQRHVGLQRTVSLMRLRALLFSSFISHFYSRVNYNGIGLSKKDLAPVAND